MSYLSLDHHKLAVSVLKVLVAAQEEAFKAMQNLFPVGSLVFVESSAGRAFTLRVTGYGCSWADPMIVRGVNVATGKHRRFYAGSDRVLRVDLPQKGGRK